MNLKLFSKIVIYIGFLFLSAPAAEAQMSPEQACDNAMSREARQCMAGLIQGAHYDPFAMQACAGAMSRYIPGCVHSAANKYYQQEAAQACESVQSSYVQGCLQSTANKVFSAQTISTCGGMSSNQVAACFARALSTPHTGGKPEPTDVMKVCSRLPNNEYAQCTELVSRTGGPELFDPLATGVCARVLDSTLLMKCIEAIAGLEFRENAVLSCASEAGHERVMTCLRAVGRPVYSRPGTACRIESAEIIDILSRLDRVSHAIRQNRTPMADREVERLKLSLSDCLNGFEYSADRRDRAPGLRR